MFKLEKLTLFHQGNELPFVYQFDFGINYFSGKNDSGKTEFYTFIDFMFGADVKLSEKTWFKDTLSHAELQFVYQNREYTISRFLSDPNKNYFRYADEENTAELRLQEYRERLNLVFSQNDQTLKELRSFVEEDVGYRTFTVFNFLGEKRQGVLNDFFDKCSSLKYAVKIPGLLNYIFNKNIATIATLKKKEESIKQVIHNLEKTSARNDDIRSRINHQLKVLGIDKTFTGHNADTIRYEVSKFQTSLRRNNSNKKSLTVTELETIYTSLDEQLKRQESFEHDHTEFIADDIKQKELLKTLRDIIGHNPTYAYLVDPIIKLVNGLDKSISFNKYLIQENTIHALKKQREEVRQQLLSSKQKYSIYSVSDKSRAVTLIDEYLNYYDGSLKTSDLSIKKSELRKIQEEIRALQHANNQEQIDSLSADITRLYKSTTAVSDLSEYDFEQDGFRITYFKNGNILQPQISDSVDSLDESAFKNYYTGSMARHTLIQLCGYLSFLRMLIREKKYPLIPILVIDHISKPFDKNNMKSIGAVLHEAYNGIEKSDLQIILFDDEKATNLGIKPDYETDLLTEEKTGFNPFYHVSQEGNETAPTV